MLSKKTKRLEIETYLRMVIITEIISSEDIMVQTTIGIDGMQCEMCEAHVNEAIRKAFPEIKEVRSSHRKKTTRILSNEVIDENALRSVIASTGYEFLSCKSEPYQPKGLFAALKGWFS